MNNSIKMFCQTVLLLYLTIFSHCATTPYSTNNPKICKSETCATESTIVKSHLDQTVDPCENFYKFACGKYVRETILADDKAGQTSFDKLQDKVREQMITVLTEDPQPNEPYAFRLAKQFTGICINENGRNKNGVKPLLEIFEKFGGWPVLKNNNWISENWNLLNGSKQLFNHGLISDVILEFSVSADYRNSSKRVLYVSCCSLTTFSENFSVIFRDFILHLD